MLQRQRHFRALVVPAVVGTALVLGLSACGSGSKGAEVASLGSDSTGTDVTTTTTAQSSQEQVLKFVACLRDQGLDVPDPKFDADGNLDSRIFERDGTIDPRSDTVRAAVETCRDLVGDVRLGPGGGRRFDREQMQSLFNDFTSCLRTNGIEVDDVTLPERGNRPAGASGAAGAAGASGPQGGFGPPPDGERPRDGQGFNPTQRLMRRLNLDENDAKVQAAVTKCEPALTAAMQKLRGSDGGGGDGPDGGGTATTSKIKFAS